MLLGVKQVLCYAAPIILFSLNEKIIRANLDDTMQIR